MKRSILFLLILCLPVSFVWAQRTTDAFGFSSPAERPPRTVAEETPSGEEVEPSPRFRQALVRYAAAAGKKMDFGLVNTMMGWTEFFTEPGERCKEHKHFEAVFPGIFAGTFNAAADTSLGLLNFATSPIPVSVPLPEGGVNVRELTAGV